MAFGDRRKPLKRDGEGARKFAAQRSRLDAGDTSGFRERGRVSGARSLAASARASVKRRRDRSKSEGPLTPQEWMVAVYLRDGERCTVTGRRVPGLPSNFHHVYPKRLLREAGLLGVVWDPDNGMTVDDVVHANHEAASARIPREAIPARCIEFARRHGFMGYIEKNYPAAGAAAAHPNP